MKSMLLMRMQGIEQEVCQLFFATFRQMGEFVSGKGTTFAAFCHIASTNEVAFVYSVAL